MKCALILLALTYALAAPVEDDNALAGFVTFNQLLTADIYKEVVKQDSGNLIVSPVAVEAALAYFPYEGTVGATAYKSVLPKLEGTSDDSLKVSIANKIYVEHGVELGDTFKSVPANVYGSGVEIVSFEHSVDRSAEINSWVEEHTNHKIQNIISPDAITDETKIGLAHFFNVYAEWRTEFYAGSTRKSNFFTSKDVPVATQLMQTIGFYSFYENSDLDAKFLELPLTGGDVSVVFVLPNQIDGLANLEKNIVQVLAPQPLARETVVIDLPRFTIESRLEFVPNLVYLDDHSFYVSNVHQQTFVNVTEKGIEATAGSEVIVTRQPGASISFNADHPFLYTVTAEPEASINFNADHPFLFYIKDDDLIRFVGRYVDPKTSN